MDEGTDSPPAMELDLEDDVAAPALPNLPSKTLILETSTDSYALACTYDDNNRSNPVYILALVLADQSDGLPAEPITPISEGTPTKQDTSAVDVTQPATDLDKTPDVSSPSLQTIVSPLVAQDDTSVVIAISSEAIAKDADSVSLTTTPTKELAAPVVPPTVEYKAPGATETSKLTMDMSPLSSPPPLSSPLPTVSPSRASSAAPGEDTTPSAPIIPTDLISLVNAHARNATPTPTTKTNEPMTELKIMKPPLRVIRSDLGPDSFCFMNEHLQIISTDSSTDDMSQPSLVIQVKMWRWAGWNI